MVSGWGGVTRLIVETVARRQWEWQKKKKWAADVRGEPVNVLIVNSQPEETKNNRRKRLPDRISVKGTVQVVTCAKSRPLRAKTSLGERRVWVGMSHWATKSKSMKLSSAPESMSTWRGSECCGHWREPWSWIWGEGESEEAVRLVSDLLRHDELCCLTAQNKNLV